MNKVCASAPQLASMTPYDPKYLPAQVFLSANENPLDVPPTFREEIEQAICNLSLNRYPDPLANDLREMIARENGLPSRDWVLVGNGGDELLFNTALAWGGPGRVALNFPPTFSTYENSAQLTGTNVVNIPRSEDENYPIDEAAVFEYIRAGKRVDYITITSPNNPTGLCAPLEFVERLLAETEALVFMDEAYFEFSGKTVLPLLKDNKNLVILRTFSKAFSLAGVRLGYIFAHPEVIAEYIKVRQPYSVDALSQAVGCAAYKHREEFEMRAEKIIAEREQMQTKLAAIAGIRTYPSEGNWILFKIAEAARAWEFLYERGVLVRDFSAAKGLENSLRVTIGSPEENAKFLATLQEFVKQEGIS